MQESMETMRSKVEVFNKYHSPGSRVFVIKDDGEKFSTTVRAKAQILSGHTAVVWLDGITGCYDLNRVIGGIEI